VYLHSFCAFDSMLFQVVFVFAALLRSFSAAVRIGVGPLFVTSTGHGRFQNAICPCWHRGGRRVRIGDNTDSPRTQDVQRLNQPRPWYEAGWEGSRMFPQTFVSSRSVVPERNHLSLNNEELMMLYSLG